VNLSCGIWPVDKWKFDSRAAVAAIE
jgi:hypothetical protein